MEAYENVYGTSNHIVIIKGKQPLIAMDLINPAATAAAAAAAAARMVDKFYLMKKQEKAIIMKVLYTRDK